MYVLNTARALHRSVAQYVQRDGPAAYHPLYLAGSPAIRVARIPGGPFGVPRPAPTIAGL